MNERRKALKAKAKVDASAEDDDGKPSQADTLVKYACEAAQFYNNPNNEDETYALVQMNGHRECWLLKSTGFKAWLRFQYFSRTGARPKADAFNQALDTLDAKARFEGPSAPVFLRRAEHEGKIYIDLCDEAWRAIEIDANGWRIVDEPPVHFIRRRGMLPLPEPVHGASIDELRPFLNGATERDFVLMVMWLLSALSPSGPYPLLAVVGGPGTAKTTTGRLLRDLFDPNAGKVRRVPKSEEDLFVQAAASACLVYDNLSSIAGMAVGRAVHHRHGRQLHQAPASHRQRRNHPDRRPARSHYQRRGSRHAHRPCQPGRYRQSRRHRGQQAHDGTRVQCRARKGPPAHSWGLARCRFPWACHHAKAAPR